MSISISSQKKKKRMLDLLRCAFPLSHLISTDVCAPGEGEPSAWSTPLFASPSFSLYLTSQSQLHRHMWLWMLLLKMQHEKNPALQVSPLIPYNDGVGAQTTSCNLVLHFNCCQLQNYWHPFIYFKKKCKYLCFCTQFASSLIEHIIWGDSNL